LSGIYGIFYKEGAPVTSQVLEPLKAAMVQWGPDGQGTWCQGSVGLGHLMLHTTPESLNERLPATHPHDPNLTITADARIDNRDDILAALNISPAERLPDSTLILLAYERWGQACVDKLIGDFAFVIWDQRQQLLFCGRDIMGCKPFFYYNDKHCFIFASDIEGVLAYSGVPQRLNETLLAAYLQEDTYFAEKRYTFLADIVKLPPAHQMLITASRHQLTQYWSLDNVREVHLPSDEAYAEQLRELLFQAVQCRVRTPFPVGTHLSGGLDSSTVTAIAARTLREKGQRLTAYSWSPAPPSTGELPDDERKLIQLLCNRESIQCHYIDLKVEDVVRTYRRDFTRQPYEMMLREELTQRQAAQNNVRIMLSGWGGDEMITGHGWGYWSNLFLRGRWWKLHQEMLSFVEHNEVTGRRKLKQYAGMTYNTVLLPMIPEFIWMRWRGNQSVYPLTCIQPSFASQHQNAVRTLRGPSLRGPSLRERSSVQKMQWCWLDNGHLTKRIEAWAINGARQQLVYHYPLLDRRILEFGLGTPSDQFVQQGWNRSLVRRATKDLLPETIRLNRSKVELAAFDVIGSVTVQALRELFDELGTENCVHPANKCVDLKKLKEVVKQTGEFKREVEVLLNIMACVNVLKNSTTNRN
jgi:asparagine synthase (glutamine-hydrolysing)